MKNAFIINGKQYIPATDLSWSDVHGEHVIIDARTGEYHVLNEVGRLIWLAITEGGTAEQLLCMIQMEFSVSKETAEADLNTFVADLSGRGLLNFAT